NQVTVLGIGRIHLDHYRGGCAFHAHGLEETAEQFIKTDFKPWIVRDKVLHTAFLLNSHATGRGPNCCLCVGPPPKKEMARLRVGPPRKSKWHRHVCCA